MSIVYTVKFPDEKKPQFVCTSKTKIDPNRRYPSNTKSEILNWNSAHFVKIVRGAIYLWAKALIAQGLTGEHNHYTAEQRALVQELDDPQKFLRKATAEVDSLPMAEIKTAGFFERMFGRAS